MLVGRTAAPAIVQCQHAGGAVIWNALTPLAVVTVSLRAPADAAGRRNHVRRASIRRHAPAIKVDRARRAGAVALPQFPQTGWTSDGFTPIPMEERSGRASLRRRHALPVVGHVARRAARIDAQAVAKDRVGWTRLRNETLTVGEHCPGWAGQEWWRQQRRQELGTAALARQNDVGAHKAVIVRVARLVVVVDEPATNWRHVLGFDQSGSVALQSIHGRIRAGLFSRRPRIKQPFSGRPDGCAARAAIKLPVRSVTVAKRHSAIGVVILRRQTNCVLIRAHTPKSRSGIARLLGMEAKHARLSAGGKIDKVVVASRRTAFRDVEKPVCVERYRRDLTSVLQGRDVHLEACVSEE